MTDQAPELLPMLDLVKNRFALLCERNDAMTDDADSKVRWMRNSDEIGFLQSVLRAVGEKTALPPLDTRPTPSERPARAEPVRDACCETGILPSARPVAQAREALEIALEQAREAFDYAKTKDDHMICEMRYRTFEAALAALTSERPSESAVAWQTRCMYDKGHAREKEWCDWRDCTEKWFQKTNADIANGAQRLQIRALYAIQHGDAVRAQTIEEIERVLNLHLKIGGHDAWEGHYYFVDGIKAAARALLASERVSERETMTSVPADRVIGELAAEQVAATTYTELIASYEAEEGYPAESWIDRFEAMPFTAIGHADAADFLVNKLPVIAKTISCMQVRIADAKDRHSERPMKRIEYITGGWSGAEDLIGAMLRQFWIGHFHSRWERGGYFVFEVPDFFLSPSKTPDDSLVLKNEEHSETVSSPHPTSEQAGSKVR